MAEYYNVTTNLGDAEIANAIAANTKLNITHIAFGDGNGSVPTPNKARTSLVREVHRQAVTKYERHATNANWIVIETIIPSSIGGFWVREMGIIANGKLISHGSHAPFEKVADPSGVSEYRLRFTQNVTDGSVVEITLDESLIYASQAWVEENFIKRSEIVDNLTTNDATKPVSAKQAKVLQDNKLGKTENAVSATKLQTARKINNVDFDGTKDITIADSTKLPLSGGKLTGKLIIDTPTLTTEDNQLLVKAAPGRQAQVKVENDLRGGFMQVSGSGRYGLWDATNAKWLLFSELDGINGSCNVNAVSATKLATIRSLSFSGDASGTMGFDGSADVSTNLTLSNTGVVAGTYKSVTVDVKGRISAGNDVITGLVTATTATGTANQATSNTNTFLNIAEKIGSATTTVGTSTQVTGAGTVSVTSDTTGKITITGAQSITGNAATATKLATPRTINGVNFDGTTNISIPTATTSVSGTVQLNNTLTSTSTSQALTAAQGKVLNDRFVNDFLSLKSENGYQKLPGGLIIQWGLSTGVSSRTATFPIAFPNECLNISGSTYLPLGNFQTCSFRDATNQNFGIQTGDVNNAAQPNPVKWIAIGY